MWHGRKQRNREGEILFMDLRQWTENPVKGEQKKKVILKDDQIKRATEIYLNGRRKGLMVLIMLNRNFTAQLD